jgi:hypothetical protein
VQRRLNEQAAPASLAACHLQAFCAGRNAASVNMTEYGGASILRNHPDFLRAFC